jgi:hypothetical protein
MAVTLHTTLGDIKLEIFCDLTPRTAKVGRDAIQLSVSPPVHASCASVHPCLDWRPQRLRKAAGRGRARPSRQRVHEHLPD